MEKKNNRIEEIDALRGIAALSVVLFHYTTIYDFRHNVASTLGWHFTIGYYGVYLFFVISGFVILLTLQNCRTGLDFAISRFSRIFPAYWTAVITSFVLLEMLGTTPAQSFPQLAVNFTMLERIIGYNPIDSVYWTLNVEMSFYLWMWVVFKLGWLKKIQTVISFVLAFQLLMAIYSHSVNHIFSQGIRVVFLLEYARLFCAGMLFFEAREYGFTLKRLLLLMWCWLNQMFIPFRDFEWQLPGMVGDLAVLGVFFIMFLVVRGQLRWLVNPVLLYLGAISYTLYLLHNKIGNSMRDDLTLRGYSPWQAFWMALIFSCSLATLVTFLVERRAMMAIRQRYRVWKNRDESGTKKGDRIITS